MDTKSPCAIPEGTVIGNKKVPKEAIDPAAELLMEALKIVQGARRQAYGTPEDNFQVIADLWNAIIRKKISVDRQTIRLEPTDVACMMVLVKIARLAETPEHRDSWVDTAGYAACGVRCAERRKDS